MPVTPPTRVYRTWTIDSRRWQHYRPRPGDIVIATYPKSGTTWMQRIVALLIFQDTAPLPLMDVSPWIDCRFLEPVEATIARMEAQTHRRFLKAHLPADGLPLHEEVRYIHVARDGRDTCLSYFNHVAHLTPWALERFDRAGMADETLAAPYPPVPTDPAAFFHRWITAGIAPDTDGLPLTSWFHFERSWWAERGRENVLLAHHADLQADLGAEMRRIADFLGIAVPAALWPGLVEAAGFDAMRRIGDTLLGRAGAAFEGGGATFFHRGTSGRWRGVLAPDDLARYNAKCAALPTACAAWLEAGCAGMAARAV